MRSAYNLDRISKEHPELVEAKTKPGFTRFMFIEVLMRIAKLLYATSKSDVKSAKKDGGHMNYG